MEDKAAEHLRSQTRKNWNPPERISVSEWAEKYRVLAGESASEPGPWRNSRTPYLVEVMNAFSDPSVEEIVMLKASQAAGTEGMFNCLGYTIDQDPGPTLIVYPDDGEARKISRGRIQPMIDATEVLAKKKPGNPDDYATQVMRFPGMPIYIVGANSPSDLASNPCRYVYFDETDKYPRFSGREAGGIDLGEERQKTFWNKKRFKASTPTDEDGAIWKAWQRCDERRHFHVACPHCAAMQTFDFDQLRYPDDLDKEAVDYLTRIQCSAWYECFHCQGKIFDVHKMKALRSGHWVPEKKHPHPKSIGFHINSLYSPFLTFGDCARAMVEADLGDRSKKMNFCNSWKGLPYKDVAIETAGISLKEKVLPELPALMMPAIAVALCCGIDMQKYGFYLTVWAFAATLESWKIQHLFVPTWADLERLVFETTYPVQGSDRKVHIWRAAIDTGGGNVNNQSDETEDWSRTAEAYNWVRLNGRGVIFATKGLSNPGPGSPLVRMSVLDKMPGRGGGPIPGGLALWLINSDRNKENFFHRLQQSDIDGQPVHFCAGTDEAFFKQILSEEKRRDIKGKYKWHRKHKSNHYLDASLLAHALADPEWAGGIPLLARFEAQRKQEQMQKDNQESSSGSWVNADNNWIRR